MPERPATLLDYDRRVARAMRFINDHLDGPLDLARIADAAAFSPCHFHRIFRAIAGETVAEHVTRARLSRAAKDLIDGRLPLARVARRAGYSGMAAFGRAFRLAYGIAPAVYRAQGGIGRVEPAHPTHPKESTMFDVTIHDYPALRLAAIAHQGPYHGIGAAFDRLSAWAQSRGLLRADSRFFGRYFDDPKSVAPEQCRSEACMTLAATDAVDDAVRLVVVPAFRAAMLRFRGPYAELERPYEWFYGTWLPASGEEPADLPCLEEYPNDPRTTPPAELITDIIMPLKVRVPVSA
jgi:AraC family transcriptional regulator